MSFDEGLIKGKIAEIVFEEMFHKQGQFEVIQNGYEYTNPEIAQNLQNLNKEFFVKLRHKPDFILLSWDKKEKFLVEVKFRSIKDDKRILEIAENLRINYGPVFLFLATPEKFYFGSCMKIIENGYIDELAENWITKEKQEKYLKLLNKYIHTS